MTALAVLPMLTAPRDPVRRRGQPSGGSALGVAILSATLVAVHGTTGHRTEVAMFVAAGFALAGLLATRVVPPGPALAPASQPQHLFHHHAGGIP